MIGVTLDTNIYVSALEFGGINSRLLGMARTGAFRIDVSDAILNELVACFATISSGRAIGYTSHGNKS